MRKVRVRGTGSTLQGGKTFCASFCASLIAGSRRAFSVCWQGLFVAGVSWVKCTRCERLLPVKHFYLTCLLFFRRLKITLDSEQPTLKEKRIIPSIWGGIKGFEHFLRGVFFWLCIRLICELISPGWIRTRLYSVISSYGYFFYTPRFITFAEPDLSWSSVKEPYCCYDASEWTNLCA